MSKISQYASNTSPALGDYVIGNQASGPTTKKILLSDLLTLFLNNIPAAEGGSAFVSTGMVWSGDAYASTRAASMTSGRVKVNSTFLALAAVTARVFTASKDTYVDCLDNLDGTGTLVYTEVTNNAASPALAANSIRIGIIVTGASTIAAVGSVNQGQIDKILPIASSIAYATTDSLGNLICNRDPNSKLLGARQLITTQATSSQTDIQTTGVSVPFLATTLRKVKATFVVGLGSKDAVPSQWGTSIWDGTVGSGTRLARTNSLLTSASVNTALNAHTAPHVPSAGLHTYNGGLVSDPGGPNTVTITGASNAPVFLMVEQF